jgi:hypothetical protein
MWHTIKVYTLPVAEGVTVAKCPQNRNTAPILSPITALHLRIRGLAVGTRNIPIRAWPGGNLDTKGQGKEEKDERGFLHATVQPVSMLAMATINVTAVLSPVLITQNWCKTKTQSCKKGW